jgi:acetoin utilization deacetylase AcuC-like enzyme
VLDSGALVLALYSDRFVLPLPEGHRFPMQKYRLLRESVQAQIEELRLKEPEAASEAQLRLAHDAEYVARVLRGELSAAELRAIGFPWSPLMVERSRRSVGATLEACRIALDEGVACNLAGGTHHAHADRGSGYCVFNDAAVAVRVLQNERPGLRVAVVDLDVHQGDGTASILGGAGDAYTLSLHGAANFPARKTVSHDDVALPDGTGDEQYLSALDAALDRLFFRFVPDLILYLAGADPHEGDRLGRLCLSFDGLAERDRHVFDAAWARRIPVALTMAGGYGHTIENTVVIHTQTVKLAMAQWRRWQSGR